MAEHHVDSWIVCIAGFLQRAGEPTGMHRLWLRTHALFASGSTCVDLRVWNDRWADVAEMIRISRNERPPRVCIAAYSWGAGWGFIRLAKELRRRDILIEFAVLSDPVYRHPYWLGNWRAFVPGMVIRVPDNVRNVEYFVQHNDLPGGHRLVADSVRTKISEPQVVPGVTHLWMDDHDEFHKTALSAAGVVLP